MSKAEELQQALLSVNIETHAIQSGESEIDHCKRLTKIRNNLIDTYAEQVAEEQFKAGYDQGFHESSIIEARKRGEI